MLNVTLLKTEQNTQAVLSSVPQNCTKMNKISEAKITSFLTPDTSSSLPHFLAMFRQHLFPQRTQGRMFVNVLLQLTADSMLILIKS